MSVFYNFMKRHASSNEIFNFSLVNQINEFNYNGKLKQQYNIACYNSFMYVLQNRIFAFSKEKKVNNDVVNIIKFKHYPLYYGQCINLSFPRKYFFLFAIYRNSINVFLKYLPINNIRDLLYCYDIDFNEFNYFLKNRLHLSMNDISNDFKQIQNIINSLYTLYSLL